MTNTLRKLKARTPRSAQRGPRSAQRGKQQQVAIDDQRGGGAEARQLSRPRVELVMVWSTEVSLYRGSLRAIDEAVEGSVIAPLPVQLPAPLAPCEAATQREKSVRGVHKKHITLPAGGATAATGIYKSWPQARCK